MKQRIAVAAILLIAVVALAGPIKVWSAGEVITANDLNANFQHIHNVMVGGHGARLMNVDVNASAGIAHSKLATPGLIAKSVFQVGTGTTACAAGTCTLNAVSGVTPVVTFNSTGNYTVTIAARTNANYVPLITPQYCGATSGGCSCTIQTGMSTTAFTVICSALTTAGPVIALANTVFGVAIFDDNN